MGHGNNLCLTGHVVSNSKEVNTEVLTTTYQISRMINLKLTLRNGLILVKVKITNFKTLAHCVAQDNGIFSRK